ncbi:MAG: hypothetical protein ACLPX5_08715 [Dissulfurispiraceae bacterium]
MRRRIFAVSTFICLLTISALIISFARQTSAAFPRVTGYAGTQGQGYVQSKIPGECGQDEEATITTKTIDLSTMWTRGIIDTPDIVLSSQFAAWHRNDSGDESGITVGGIGELSLDVKRIFCGKGGLSCAFEPSFTFAAGDDSRGLGAAANPVI